MKKDGSLLLRETACEYFGRAKEIARINFPSNEVWVNHDSKPNGKNYGTSWFTKSKAAIRAKIARACHAEGITVEDRPIGKKNYIKGY